MIGNEEKGINRNIVECKGRTSGRPLSPYEY